MSDSTIRLYGTRNPTCSSVIRHVVLDVFNDSFPQWRYGSKTGARRPYTTPDRTDKFVRFVPVIITAESETLSLAHSGSRVCSVRPGTTTIGTLRRNDVSCRMDGDQSRTINNVTVATPSVLLQWASHFPPGTITRVRTRTRCAGRNGLFFPGQGRQTPCRRGGRAPENTPCRVIAGSGFECGRKKKKIDEKPPRIMIRHGRHRLCAFAHLCIENKTIGKSYGPTMLTTAFRSGTGFRGLYFGFWLLPTTAFEAENNRRS